MENKNVENKSRCVICAAGLVNDTAYLRTLLREDDWVIAADGGIRLVQQFGLTPNAIVADFDSASRKNAEITGASITALPVKKDDTDTMAAVKIGLEYGYKDFLLLGATGGRLDHTMANLAVLMYLVNHGSKAVLADEHTLLKMMLPGQYIVEPVKNMHLSLLPYAGTVSGLYVKNVEYELNNATLTPDYPLGVSNEFIGLPVEISFVQGTLMIFLSKD